MDDLGRLIVQFLRCVEHGVDLTGATFDWGRRTYCAKIAADAIEERGLAPCPFTAADVAFLRAQRARYAVAVEPHPQDDVARPVWERQVQEIATFESIADRIEGLLPRGVAVVPAGGVEAVRPRCIVTGICSCGHAASVHVEEQIHWSHCGSSGCNCQAFDADPR